MIYSMVFNSQMGPHELDVRHLADGTVQLLLPGVAEPIIVHKGNAVRMSIQVPGAPVPVSLSAWFTDASRT